MTEENKSTSPAEQAGERHILCMKWGTKYGPEYVNRLYGMVRRHLAGNFHFVCLTDDAAGINPAVRCLPIPPLDLPAGAPERGWLKLTTFSPDLSEKHGLRGTALFLDLDVVITGALDDFFTQPGKFLIIRDYPRWWRVWKRIIGNSSVYRFELGAHPDILEYFRTHFDEVRANHRNEQHFLSHHLHRQGMLDYWPDGWCPSFKYHCIPPFPLNFWRAPTKPEGARVITFHGEVNPPDAIAGRRNKRFSAMLPAPWVDAAWRE